MSASSGSRPLTETHTHIHLANSGVKRKPCDISSDDHLPADSGSNGEHTFARKIKQPASQLSKLGPRHSRPDNNWQLAPSASNPIDNELRPGQQNDTHVVRPKSSAEPSSVYEDWHVASAFPGEQTLAEVLAFDANYETMSELETRVRIRQQEKNHDDKLLSKKLEHDSRADHETDEDGYDKLMFHKHLSILFEGI